MLNGLDLFSGVGGLSLALAPWVSPVAYCELDPYCRAVLLSRMADGSLPPAPIWDDVQTLQGAALPQIDIVYGGFPCQDISGVGRQAGIEGDRSKLFFEIIRLVREIRPAFVFLENVYEIHFPDRGLDRVIGEFAALRYDCRWGMLGAIDVGAPHHRTRWWCLAYPFGMGPQVTTQFSIEEKTSQLRICFGPAERGLQETIWLPTTAELCRVPDGVRPASHRIRALGNAVVPQCAREAFCRLMGLPTQSPSQSPRPFSPPPQPFS